MTQSHDVLVKNCKLTATISGSVSWEGLLIGKPSLIFSDNWHSSCESCSYVLSVNEVKEAIDNANNHKCSKSITRGLLSKKRLKF